MRLVTQFGGAGVTLISTVVVLRTLGESDFGRLSLVIALVTIVVGISDLGLSGVGVREWIRRPPSERNDLLADLLGLRLIATAAAAILAVAGAVAAGYDSTVVLGLTAALVGAGFNAVQSALTIPLIAGLRQGLVGLLELLRVSVQALLQVVLVLAGLGVVPLAATLIPAGIVGVLAIIRSLGGRVPVPRFRFRRLGPLMRESAAFAAAGAVSIVYLRIPVLLGPGLMTPDEFGSFTVAFRAMESLTMFPAILTGALFPVLAHAAIHDPARLARGYDVLWRSTVFLGVAGGAGVMGGAPLIALTLSGSTHPVTVDSLALLGLALSALFVGAAAMWMLLAQRAYLTVLTINLAALTVNVGATLTAGHLLAPTWFAAGILASEVVIAVAADRSIRARLSREGHRPPDPSVDQVVATLALVAGTLVFLATKDYSPVIPLVCVVTSAVAVPIATRRVPRELLDLGRELSRRTFRRVLGGSAE